MVKVIVDYRERKIFDYIKHLNCEMVIDNLMAGDILILKDNIHPTKNNYNMEYNGSAIIIERKTISDFVSSIRSRRIWEQVFKLMYIDQLMGYRIDHKVLVVQQSFEEYFAQIPWWNEKRATDKRSFWRYIISTMVDIIFVYQIPIIFLFTDEQFYEFLNILIKRDIRYWNSWAFEAKRYSKWAINKFPVKDNRLLMLYSIPFVGRILGERLLDSFGSIEKIAKASVKKLNKVKGIGKRKAETIFDLFHNKEIAKKK